MGSCRRTVGPCRLSIVNCACSSSTASSPLRPLGLLLCILASMLACVRAVPMCTPGCNVQRLNQRPCGFRTGIECLPRPYNITDLTALPSGDLQALYLQTRHEAALACKNSSFISRESGAWCLIPHGLLRKGSDDLPKGHGPPSPQFVRSLDQFLRVDTDDGTKVYHSVADFGAGVGQLGKALQAVDQLHKYRAYDGSGNVESWTRGYVKFADMTTPLSLPKAHWVISTEAGEHVPNAMESNFIRNLHLHNCLGIILTWASLNQGGYGHINTHDPLYLMELFEELDYVLDVPSTARLLSSRGGHNLTAAEQCVSGAGVSDVRASEDGVRLHRTHGTGMFGMPSTRYYPCGTLMVLRRKQPLDSCV